MSEELKPESTELIVLPIEEQISQELVRANVTEAIIADLEARLLPLKISGIDDKETYLIVKEGRKECKALRVAAKKICTNGREQAVAISKAWIAKEKEVTTQIAKVEDYLQKQEDEYEAEVEKEKEARKRKQDEQLITRQQVLVGYGALFSDGKFVLGDVSFEFSLIKESDDDVWKEAILPKYEEEYNKIQAEQLELDRKKKEAEDELKRQQEELEQKQKELAQKEADLKAEAGRQADEARKAREAKELARTDQLLSLGLKFDFVDHFKGYDCFVPMLDLRFHDDAKWNKLIEEITAQVGRKKAEEAEEKRKEQERKDLQNKRYAELLPFKEYGEPVEMDSLWSLTPATYSDMLGAKKAVFDFEQEEQKRKIAEDAAKKERERIEEEQRQAEVKRIKGLREFRVGALAQYGMVYDLATGKGDLGEMSDDSWWELINEAKTYFEEAKRKQEEERKSEELAQASDKTKWADMMKYLQELYIHDFKSGPYRKKAAILREKLEEIKAL